MFKINPHSEVDKSFTVYSDCDAELEFEFDYDDVNHERVDKAAEIICTILNANIGRIGAHLLEFDKRYAARIEAGEFDECENIVV